MQPKIFTLFLLCSSITLTYPWHWVSSFASIFFKFFTCSSYKWILSSYDATFLYFFKSLTCLTQMSLPECLSKRNLKANTTTKACFYIGSTTHSKTILNRLCSQRHKKSRLSMTVSKTTVLECASISKTVL